MKPKVGLVLFEGVHIYVVPKTDYDALAAGLAEEQAYAERMKAAYDMAHRQAMENGAAANAAEARLAEAERDAARYRFIKQWARRLDITGYSLTNNEHFEPRIDEAMQLRPADSASVAPVYQNECICPNCGIRHGGAPSDGSF